MACVPHPLDPPCRGTGSALVGIKTRPRPDAPFAWRVFVADRSLLPLWLGALGPDAIAEPIDACAADLFCRCEVGRLYSWGDAPVLSRLPRAPSSPPPPAGAPMWHPRDSPSGGRTHHISARSFANSDFSVAPKI